MSQEKKPTPVAAVAKPAGKPAKKLVPRTASKAAASQPPALPATAAAIAAVPSPVSGKPVRQPSPAGEALAKPEKSATELPLESPAMASAKPAKPEKPGKVEKPAKPRKVKLVRDSYAMPEEEYARIALLKKRLAGLGQEVKKSELLRGGLALLVALNDAELKAVMGRVERIKTGRPAK